MRLVAASYLVTSISVVREATSLYPVPSSRRRLGARGGFRRLPWLLFLFIAGFISAVVLEYRIPEVGASPSLLLYRHDLGQTVEIDLETYLLGVVAAEMPATFQLEALKAQAVAARTYAIHALENGTPLADAGGAILTTDHRSAQAWISKEAFWERWGREARFRWRRIAQAVVSTHGQVITYAGAPILAAYHSSSGGYTESAENYWSGSAPYLQAVADPYDAVSPHRGTVVSVSVSTLLSRLGVGVPASGGASHIVVSERYPSGRVRTLRLGDATVTGRQVREALGLRSSLFSVDVEGDTVHFVTDGYGHGIGMSQYGAEGMAREGYTYDAILRYYYTGVELTQWYE